MADLGTPAFTWGELRAIVTQSPQDSAIGRQFAEHPHDWQLELLRQMQLGLAVLDWRIISLFKRGAKPPKPLLFPWEEPHEDDAIVGDAMSLEEAADFLGWEIEVS